MLVSNQFLYSLEINLNFTSTYLIVGGTVINIIYGACVGVFFMGGGQQLFRYLGVHFLLNLYNKNCTRSRGE